jgi:Peptidase family M23
MFRATSFIALLLVVLLASSGEAAAAQGWRRPLGGGVMAKAFAYDRGAPFVRGARRGIDLSASPGARVGAVCGGVVTWAGRVPGWGKGVTLRCPRGLVATELGLASVAAARGARVLPGTTLGRLWSQGVLRVAARRAHDRFGYVDPAPLFVADAVPPAVAPSPLARRPRVPRRVALRPAPVLVPHPAAARAPARPPLPILAGAALLALAASGGVVRGRRARRRWAPEPAAVQR